MTTTYTPDGHKSMAMLRAERDELVAALRTLADALTLERYEDNEIALAQIARFALANLRGYKMSRETELVFALRRAEKAEAELSRLKDDNAKWKAGVLNMPMKYKRMEFNAQLQRQVEQAEAERDKLRALCVGCLQIYYEIDPPFPADAMRNYLETNGIALENYT